VKVEARSIRPIDRIEMIRNGEVVGTWRPINDAGRKHCTAILPVQLAGSSWIAVRCFEEAMPNNIRFAHSSPIFLDHPNKPLRPSKRETDWLIQTIDKQIKRLDGKLAPEAVNEFRQARKECEKIANP
jgi:hypothetical protein